MWIPEDKSKSHTTICIVRRQVLREHSDRALFLCYPDDFEDSDESMALQCLNNYSGDTVIHVGEWLGQTLCLPEAWYAHTHCVSLECNLSTYRWAICHS